MEEVREPFAEVLPREEPVARPLAEADGERDSEERFSEARFSEAGEDFVFSLEVAGLLSPLLVAWEFAARVRRVREERVFAGAAFLRLVLVAMGGLLP